MGFTRKLPAGDDASETRFSLREVVSWSFV